MTTKEKAEILEQVAMYENTEVGDYWINLTNLYLYRSDYATEEFILQTGVEIEIQYQDMLDILDDTEFRNLKGELPEDLRENIYVGRNN